MKCYCKLHFLCCTISICFVNFDHEYIEFFKEIYSVYLDIGSKNAKFNCNILLKQIEKSFVVSLNMRHYDVYDIKDLYNIIHFLICNTICLSSNQQGLMVLHSSSIVYAGKLILLAGIKSSGKTTALLYFLMNGATYLGDEAVIVSSNGVIPCHLPLRVKKSTINYLKEKFGYEFEFYELPFGIDRKKQYLLQDNNFGGKKIEEWERCDKLIFLNEGYFNGKVIILPKFEAVNRLLKCVRNNASECACLGALLLKNCQQFSTDFSVPLEELKKILDE